MCISHFRGEVRARVRILRGLGHFVNTLRQLFLKIFGTEDGNQVAIMANRLFNKLFRCIFIVEVV